MRAVSLCATVALLAATLPLSAQQPASPRTPAPGTRRPATPAPAPRKEVVVPFRVGETLTYDVAWSNYLVAGTAVSRVVEKRPSYNSTAYYIVAEGRPLPIIARFYSVYYKMDALLDSFSTLSQRTSLYVEEGTRKRFTSMLFNRSTRRAEYEYRVDEKPQTDEFPIPVNVQDGLSTLYALRSRTFKAGDQFTIPVADDGSLYTVKMVVNGPEPVKVPLGQIDSWNVRITILDASNQPVGQNIGAWISTDARRLPLRLQADLPVGNFALALRTAQ
jgi:hypothetical protein